MQNLLASKLTKKSRWFALTLAGVFAALTAASCSVDKGKYTFDDDAYANAMHGGGKSSGGQGNPSGGGDPEGGTGNTNTNGGMNSGGEAGDANPGGGAPNTDCTPGEFNCTPDGHLQTCKAGTPPAFDAGKACGGDGLCSASRGTCLKCAPGEFQCASNVLQQCNILGSEFEDTATCDSKTACVASGQKGYCVRCKAGQNSCEATEVHILASPDDKAVYDSNHLVTCNVDGSGTDTTATCVADSPICDPDKKCLSCQPNAIFCDGNSVARCNATGTSWSNTYCMSGTTCDATAGKCVPEQGCAAGTFQCTGSTLSYCVHGKFTSIDTCDNGMICDAQNGRCQKCAVNGSTCTNGNSAVQYCDYNSQQATPYIQASCLQGTCTQSGNNASCAYCQPGAITCYDGSPSYATCSAAAGLQYLNCPKDAQGNQTVCSTALQKCVTCVPGRATCNAGILKTCNPDGNSYTTKDCQNAGMQCDQGRAQCTAGQVGNTYCTPEGDSMRVGFDKNHQLVGTLIEKCGLNQCNGDGTCRPKRCVLGQITCSGADVYACTTDSDRRERTGMHCSSAARCQDGFGCVKVLGLAAGDAHTCAIVAGADATEGDSGYAMCWGANESGQLGDGSPLFADSKEPRQVLVGNKPGQAPTLANYFSAVSAGKNFTCADIAAGDGTFVVCWGSNAKGQLGVAIEDPGPFNGPFDGVKSNPGDNEKPLDLHGVTCGSEFACALGPNGGAWCWGANEDGQLGNGNTTASNAPALIDGHSFTQITAGGHHVCGVKADNTVWCWGDGALGQLGNTTKKDALTPTLVGKVSAVADRPMALGNDFSLALGTKAFKNPFAWGTNTFGQLADDSTDDTATPVSLTGLLTADFLNSNTIYSGATAEHACARLGDRLFCWGANVFGEVGDGTTDDRTHPVQVLDAKTDATKLAPGDHSVAVGGRHTCALTAKGDVMCWGANHRYQLGSAALSPQVRPIKGY